jgi:hypothetical protein
MQRHATRGGNYPLNQINKVLGEGADEDQPKVGQCRAERVGEQR